MTTPLEDLQEKMAELERHSQRLLFAGRRLAALLKDPPWVDALAKHWDQEADELERRGRHPAARAKRACAADLRFYAKKASGEP